MARDIIYSGLQIGAEATPGTAVAANLKLLSTMLMPAPEAPSETVQATGQRADTAVIVGKHNSRLDISGKANATDLFYWFNSAIGGGTVATNTITMRLNQGAPAAQSYTVEFGDASNITRVSGARVTSLGIDLSPNAAPTFSGQLIGRQFVETGTMTATPTEVSKVHFGPRRVSVWISNDVAGLTTVGNKLSDQELLGFSFSIDSLAEGVFGISDTESLAFVADQKPTIGANLSMIREAKARGYYTDMLGHAVRYCRVLMTEGTSNLDIRFPFQFADPGSSESSGQYMADFRLNAIFDGTGGSFLGTALQVAFTSSWITSTPGSLLTAQMRQAQGNANLAYAA